MAPVTVNVKFYSINASLKARYFIQRTFNSIVKNYPLPPS
jgi:hypothetical protein